MFLSEVAHRTSFCVKFSTWVVFLTNQSAAKTIDLFFWRVTWPHLHIWRRVFSRDLIWANQKAATPNHSPVHQKWHASETESQEKAHCIVNKNHYFGLMQSPEVLIYIRDMCDVVVTSPPRSKHNHRRPTVANDELVYYPMIYYKDKSKTSLNDLITNGTYVTS